MYVLYLIVQHVFTGSSPIQGNSGDVFKHCLVLLFSFFPVVPGSPWLIISGFILTLLLYIP